MEKESPNRAQFFLHNRYSFSMGAPGTVALDIQSPIPNVYDWRATDLQLENNILLQEKKNEIKHLSNIYKHQQTFALLNTNLT